MNLSIEPIQYIVFLILIKLAFITIVTALLANFDYYAAMLFNPSKTTKTKFILSAFICASLIIGLILRFQANYHAMDITVPGLFICGVVAGFLPAITSAAVLSFVLIMFAPEYFTFSLFFAAAIAGSIFYRSDVFEYKRRFYRVSLGMLPVTIISAVMYRYAPVDSMFILSNRTLEADILVAGSDLLAVFLSLFILRYFKTKLELVDNSYNLNKARLAILSSKINPHFLFNTLNTIASAIRINPEMARDIVFRLSEILRYVLQTENEFKPLQDEINFIENYLSIEKSRFGEERLKVDLDIDDKSKEVLIPSMLIQPLVENSIKHGIKNLTNRRGEVKLRTVCYKEENEPFLLVEVSDNGEGVETDEETLFSKGIGLPNVRDRLKLLYGDKARFMFSSILDDSTTVSIIIPARR
jgi:two-component system LytT family sensor kinase